MAVVDTSALIDVFKGNPAAQKAFDKAETEEGRLCYSAMSSFELALGVPPGIADKRKTILGSFQSVPVSDRIAERAGLLHQHLRKLGQDIGPSDCIIAATALTLNEPVVTRNAKHFQRVENLRVITY